jgi:hypothetical protein
MEEDSASAELTSRRLKDRRQRRFSFVLRERRSGFDRRVREGAGRVSVASERALLALRDRPRVLFGLLVVVNALIADFPLTNAGGGGGSESILILFLRSALRRSVQLAAVLLTSWLAWRCHDSGGWGGAHRRAIFTAVCATTSLG